MRGLYFQVAIFAATITVAGIIRSLYLYLFFTFPISEEIFPVLQPISGIFVAKMNINMMNDDGSVDKYTILSFETM